MFELTLVLESSYRAIELHFLTCISNVDKYVCSHSLSASPGNVCRCGIGHSSVIGCWFRFQFSHDNSDFGDSTLALVKGLRMTSMICLLVSAGQVAPEAVQYSLTGAAAAGRAVSAQRLDALGTAKPLRQLTPTTHS